MKEKESKQSMEKPYPESARYGPATVQTISLGQSNRTRPLEPQEKPFEPKYQDQRIQNNKNGNQDSKIQDSIKVLLDHHIVDNKKLLNESWVNLDKIADYCEANYIQSDQKEAALEETKNYANRALASVANQIHNFASNLATLLDLQLSNMNELEARTNCLKSSIRFTEERTSRREIGKITKPKLMPQLTPKVLKPQYPEKYAAKKRRTNYYSGPGGTKDAGSGGSGSGSIDYSVLDDIGEAHRVYERKNAKAPNRGALNGGLAQGGASTLQPGTSLGQPGSRNWSMPQVKSATRRPTKSATLSSLYGSTGNPNQDPTSGRSAAPTVRPPTPPLGAQTLSRNFSSLSRGGASGQDYRSGLGLVVAPPQLPTNYQTPKQGNNPVIPESQSKEQISSNYQQQQHRPPSTNPFLQEDDEDEDEPPPPPPPPPPEDNSWIPQTYLEKVIAMYDYGADKDDELTFKENAIIYVTAKNDDGWWEGVMNGITGLFPGNYVEHCSW